MRAEAMALSPSAPTPTVLHVNTGDALSPSAPTPQVTLCLLPLEQRSAIIIIAEQVNAIVPIMVWCCCSLASCHILLQNSGFI